MGIELWSFALTGDIPGSGWQKEQAFHQNSCLKLSAMKKDFLADVLIYENGFIKVVDIAEIAEALEKFEPSILEKVEDLLKLAYEIAHNN